VDLFHRRLDQADIHKAYSSVSIYMMICMAGCMVLCVQGVSLDGALFEAVSAMGTVGLTRGVTPMLPSLSKLVVGAMMFAGRVGSMSVAMAITRDRPQPKLRNVPEKILIG
jgi:trk system potassium uptake protein TrkH